MFGRVAGNGGGHFIKIQFRTLAELAGDTLLKSRLEILFIHVPRKKILQLGKGGMDDPSGGLRPPNPSARERFF